MGYQKLTGNEEEILEALKNRGGSLGIHDTAILRTAYATDISNLKRRKLIKETNGRLFLTERGESALTQWIKTGTIWLSPITREQEWH